MRRIEDIRKRNHSPALGPRYVVVDLTNRCNLNCLACWAYSPMLAESKPGKEWFREEISLDTMKRLVPDLRRIGVEEIRLTGGGEPLMHPRIIDIMRLVKANRIKLDITTNFTLATTQMIDEIARLKVDNVTVSLWAASPETYVRLHPNQKAWVFDKIIDSIRYLAGKGTTKLTIANVISHLNSHEIGKMVALAEMADEVYFTLADIFDETKGLALSDSERAAAKSQFQEAASESRVKIDNPDQFLRRLDGKEGLYDSTIVFEIPCTVGWTFSRILANGDVAPCCRAVKKPVGNINTESFSTIWLGRKQKIFREIGLNLKGNPKFSAEVGCGKLCDNVFENLDNFNRL